MAVAESLGIDPVSAVVQELQRTLHERAQPLLWRSTDRGLVADIAEGELLLTPFTEIGAWELSVVFHAAPPLEKPDAGPIERGRRVIEWGCPVRMQQRALELALAGVPGGPTYLGGPLMWHAVEHDGSLRMAVPNGELRISPLDGELFTLTHEDGRGIELLSLGTRAELQRQALPLCITRAAQPLQIQVHGRPVNLGSIGVPGVLGYHAQDDRSLIALVLVRGDILLLHVRGAFHRVLAELSWTDLTFGDPIEVHPSACPELEPPRPSPDLQPSPDDAAPRPSAPPTDAASAARIDMATESTSSQSHAPHTSMSERHRALCRRYFRRLHHRLRGRGARKARKLVLLILEILDQCREDISGSRLEIHARLERLLAQPLPGGPRNIRDCLDLLMSSSPFARPEPGNGCTLLFGQLHDPNSALMRFIADEEAREEAAAHAPSPATPPEPVPVKTAAPAAPPPEAGNLPTADTALTAEAPPTPQPSPIPPSAPGALNGSWDPTVLEVFRFLGRASPGSLSGPSPSPPPTHAQDPSTPPTRSQPPPTSFGPGPGPPAAPRSRSTSTPTYFLGELVDDEDETDAPSRYQGPGPFEMPPLAAYPYPSRRSQ